MQYLENWQSLLAKLRASDSDGTYVCESWPMDRGISFFDALGGVKSPDDASASGDDPEQEILLLGTSIERNEKMANCPIVAVVGMLNSGKTSLVATFLSEAGQARVLRGDANREGTHRFILWVPQGWRDDPQTWSSLHELLRDTFGAPVEDLSDAPDEAHKQYNNREGAGQHLGIPLVATDPALDQLGIGLLDCPDVQSESFVMDTEQENVRLQFVSKAARLCSAFVVVTSLSDARDGTLERIVTVVGKRMPGVSRFMAVNRIRPRYTPAQVREDLNDFLQRHDMDACFGAYHFEIADSSKYTPPAPEDISQGPGEPLPLFYELNPDDEKNPPNEIDDASYLVHVAGQLDKGQLFRERTQALWQELGSSTRRSLEQIKAYATEQQTRTRKLLEMLQGAALDCLGRKDDHGQVIELRLHLTRLLGNQMLESITRLAPWYLKPGLWMNKWVRHATNVLRSTTTDLNPVAKAKAKAKESADKIKQLEKRLTGSGHGALITPDRLARALRAEGFVEASEIDRSLVEEKCETIISRFHTENETALDADKLDQAVAEMWLKVPRWKKWTAAATSLGTLMLSMTAAMMIPLDMGASVIFAASLPELVAAAGVSGVASFLVGRQSLKDAEFEAARIQLGDFFAIACDELGLPRQLATAKLHFEVAGSRKTMHPSSLRERTATQPLVALWTVREAFAGEVEELLQSEKVTA